MSFGGYGSAGAEDPFGEPPPPYPPPGYPPPPPPTGEVNTLATLSVVFAFVFAPVGAVLGHLALAQTARGNQRGRQRAVLGLTLSYAVILLAVVAVVVWLLVGAGNNDAATAGVTTTATAPAPPAPSISSTVITPPPQTRPTVRMEALQVGDCIEIQNKQPDPNEPNVDQVFIYRAKCEIRDGVFQVEQIVMNESQCRSGLFLYNTGRTKFACTVKYGQ